MPPPRATSCARLTHTLSLTDNGAARARSDHAGREIQIHPLWGMFMRAGFDRDIDSEITQDEFFIHIVERAMTEGQTFHAPPAATQGAQNAYFWFQYFEPTLNSCVWVFLNRMQREIQASGVPAPRMP